ncbi:MAG TPA: zinc ribbon domain-containing protein [Allocoleopsis sp.]
MISFLKKIGKNIIRKSTHLQQTPINKVSLVILIIIDIFVLSNVFIGLGSISAWPLNPSEELPCFTSYQIYHTSGNKNPFELNVTTIQNLTNPNPYYPSVKRGKRLGKVSNLCTNYAKLEQEVKNTETIKKLNTEINQLNDKVSSLEYNIKTLKSQYDSTLLEKIAKQDPKKSINQAKADDIKGKIDNLNQEIINKRKEITDKKNKLIQHPSSVNYLKVLADSAEYDRINKAYQSVAFWYPNKLFVLQILFLFPLIIIGYFWHTKSTAKNQGLQSLISWHLLLIFCIPLIFKFFEFIQFGNLVRVVIDVILVLVGGLQFIASYLLIVIIPLIGFGLIKFMQTFIANPQVQAKKRIQLQRCINCNFKLQLGDEFCPNCGFNQYVECTNCHHKTYKFTTYCRSCGEKTD